MPSIANESVLVLSGATFPEGELGGDVRAMLEACRHATTTRAATATVALGIGPPDMWTGDADWLQPTARCFVWFDGLMEPEDYAGALEKLPHARFLHGPAGLAVVRSSLISLGIADAPGQVDQAGIDAMFDMQGDYLQRLRREFDEFQQRVPPGEPAKSAAWRELLGRITGSAGTYGFTQLTDMADESRKLFLVVPSREDADIEAYARVGGAIDAAVVAHKRQSTDRLPARIEADVRYRVLIVSDDPTVANQLGLALNHSRLEAVHHELPHTFHEAVRLVQPDVLLIQQSLKHFDGLDLAAQIRTDDNYAALPIIALLNDTSEDTRTRATRSGVDTWLVRPFSAESAVLSVLNMLRRVEAEQALGGRDPVTALYSRSALEDRLELELLRSRRSGELVGLMLIHIVEGVGVRYPRQTLVALAEVADATFRRSDILARYNERTIAVVLPGADPRVVMALSERVADSVDPSVRVQIAASIAEGAVSPVMVMADVETRLLQAMDGQISGAIGRCIQPVEDEDVARVRAPRVLLVDNDDAILTLLRFFCAREGLIVDDARDGLSAIEYLDRAARAGQLPDLVVMEAYLPGVDGYSVLRKIHTEYGNRIAVMMLTVQRNEERIAKAFQLGAADFVAKPFSVPEVMARIKNILLRSGAL
ncbi:MAG: DNA-binding response OmpR family regulator [Bradymonadia bacterium]|jgi:DNA-binding response OmpR family regulator